MRRSTDHILTTHAGSLPRPGELVEAILARENGALDPAVGRLPAMVADAVVATVRTQV